MSGKSRSGKEGQESERAYGTQAGAGYTCAGRGLATGGRPPWRADGGVRARAPRAASGLEVPGRGGVVRGSRPGPRRGSPHPWPSTSPPWSVCTTRAVGRGQVGVGSPGGKLEGSTLRPVPPRHPATAGRSFRARGASQGAAMLASSQRTWGG